MIKNRIGYLIKRVHQGFRSRMDQSLASENLTTAQYAVLAHLRESPGQSNAELARKAFVTPQTMIRIVTDLEQAGLIARTENPSHGRITPASLTAKGAQTLKRCDNRVMEIESLMLSGLSRTEVASLAKLLNNCAEQLEN